MTNEEKAREIANYTECNGMACWQCKEYIAIKMAEWKEQQFIMIMEKTIELFDKYPSNAVFSKNNVIEMFKTLKIAMEE